MLYTGLDIHKKTIYGTIVDEEGNEVFLTCHYKVGSLATRVLSNLKNQNKIDKNRYDKSKELTLSPGGLEFIRKYIKKTLGV